MIGLSKIFGNSKRFGKYHLKYLDEFKNHEVDVLSGAYMMLRKKVLDEVGLLDESFFMYGEDIDLSYRITQAGYKNVYFSEGLFFPAISFSKVASKRFCLVSSFFAP
jgi:GT2 family glycosyltransferase